MVMNAQPKPSDFPKFNIPVTNPRPKMCPYMAIPVSDKFGVKGMNFGNCQGENCGQYNSCSGNQLKQLADIEMAIHGVESQVNALRDGLNSVARNNNRE
jgi:hypothetical protein